MDENKTVDTQAQDDWDDMDFSDVDFGDEGTEPEAEAAESEQPGTVDTGDAEQADHSQETAETEEPAAAETKTEESTEADQSIEYKYMGEVKRCSREEAVPLIQKGADYDRIKGKLEEANAAAQSNAEAAEFVKVLAEESGCSVAELMETVNANRLSKKEGISLDEAKGRLRIQKKEAELAAREKALETRQQEEKTKNDEAAARRAGAMEFMKAYPNVKISSIPPEVFRKSAAEGISLVAAYGIHETERLAAALEAEKQNKINKERSAGSASSAGRRQPADEFDAAWYDGT